MICTSVLLPTNSFASAYKNTNKKFNITLFDRDGGILHEKRDAMAANGIAMLASKSALFVFSIIRDLHGGDVERPIIITSFDFDLN